MGLLPFTKQTGHTELPIVMPSFTPVCLCGVCRVHGQPKVAINLAVTLCPEMTLARKASGMGWVDV